MRTDLNSFIPGFMHYPPARNARGARAGTDGWEFAIVAIVEGGEMMFIGKGATQEQAMADSLCEMMLQLPTENDPTD
jgi:hypothetical protein